MCSQAGQRWRGEAAGTQSAQLLVGREHAGVWPLGTEQGGHVPLEQGEVGGVGLVVTAVLACHSQCAQHLLSWATNTDVLNSPPPTRAMLLSPFCRWWKPRYREAGGNTYFVGSLQCVHLSICINFNPHHLPVGLLTLPLLQMGAVGQDPQA